MLAAGLLPEVVHVKVITSPSMAGLVNPVISGRPGTPVLHGNINRNNTPNGELSNTPVGQLLLTSDYTVSDVHAAFYSY